MKALAAALGWIESQVVRDSVAAIIFLIQQPDVNLMPKIIGMAREALQHEGDDSILKNQGNRLVLAADKAGAG